MQPVISNVRGMNEESKLFAISCISPIPVIAFLTYLYGEVFLIIANLPYSFMCGIGFFLMVSINKLYHKLQLNIIYRVLVAGILGALFGSLVFSLLINVSGTSIIAGSKIGLSISLISFILYTYGPLHIKVKQ